MDKITIGKTTDSGALRPKAPLNPTTESKPVEARPPQPPAPPVKPAAPPAQPPLPNPVLATARSAAPAKREVKFELYQRNAKAVFLAGSFNNWNPKALPLRSSGTGKWEATLSLDPGKYEYRYVVDGKWIEDPLAKESVPNPYEGTNSILQVK